MSTVFELGPFRLDRDAGTLTRVGVSQALGPRAVAVLTVLVSNAHQAVAKNAIMEAAWPGLVVEEANLSVQISTIRRVFAQVPGGERWIETLSRRGYRFIGPVTELRDGVPQPGRRERIGNLPAALTSFVGRERELVELKRLLGKNRLLTLTGAGGIGKTRLALQLAAEVADAYRDGVWFFDLATFDDPQLVPNAVAQALGVQQSSGRSLVDALAAHVGGQRALLIFDNCEHVIGSAALLAEAMLRRSHEPTIVATSREPLRIGGEQVLRLAALSLPDPAADANAMRDSEAVLLFVDRAQHQQPDFALTDALAPAVAQLCIRLDGIPFALELAASLVRTYSVSEINARLGDRFDLLAEGSRTAMPRQRTLRATLDWSYGLLGDDERKLLRRVAIFLGGFTLEAAAAVASDETIDASAIRALLAQLVSRSLVNADTREAETRYRLLEATRAYAREKLDADGEAAAIQRRHARYFATRFERAADEWLRIPEVEWRSRYVPDVDNVRAALDASLGPQGDAATSITLAGGSGPLWTTLSLYAEGIERLDAASSRIGASTPNVDVARLSLWLGSLLEPASPLRAQQAFEHAIDLSRAIGDAAKLALARVWLARVLATLGRFDASRATLAQVLPAGDASTPKLLGIYASNAGFLDSLTGDNESALAHYEEALARFEEAGHEFGVVAATSNIANHYWAIGELDAAERAFREAVTLWRGSRSGKRNALGFALANLAGVLTERGKAADALDVAREAIPMLNDWGGPWQFMDHLALRAALAGNFESAARLAGYADRAFAAKSSEREPNEARARAKVDALLREHVDAAELARLLAAGAAMSEGAACAMALE